MIVRETPDSFVLIKQHDHAAVSGVFAENWNSELLPGPVRKESVLLAIAQHDRGWINLDDVPFWNDKDRKPYSFIDFPEAVKITHYKAGIDETEALDAYAGFLCSLHFTSFTDLLRTDAGQRFSANEELRRQLLRQKLGLTAADQPLLDYHFRMLKFCDALSIYICINKPGSGKTEEHEWYRHGIPGSEGLFGAGSPKIDASWVGRHQIQVSPSPFVSEFEVIVPYKELQKELIEQIGLVEAYRNSEPQELRLEISM